MLGQAHRAQAKVLPFSSRNGWLLPAYKNHSHECSFWKILLAQLT